MRVMSWNVEWMNSWFVPNSERRVRGVPEFRGSYAGGTGVGGGAIRSVRNLAERVAAVIESVEPHVVLLQEAAGPDEVQLFADTYLRGNWTAIGGASASGQYLGAIYRRAGGVNSVTIAQDQPSLDLRRRNEPGWQADTDADFELEQGRFARIPQTLDINTTGGETIRAVNCHLKSKFVRRGEQLWTGTPRQRRSFVRQALEARRRISAEAYRIRRYVDEVLEDGTDLVLVAGDLNDGVGFDYFEDAYLTASVVDVIFGSVARPDLQLVHSLYSRVNTRLYTAVFDNFVSGVNDQELLLDHALASPALDQRITDARIPHQVYEGQITGSGEGRGQRPADHRPVVVEIRH